LQHDAGRTAPFAAGAINDEARVATQHSAVAVWHEVLVDWNRGEHDNLLAFMLAAIPASKGITVSVLNRDSRRRGLVSIMKVIVYKI
jgi:hypothetical protein